MTRERITAVVGALALVGTVRSAWLHFVSEPAHDFMRAPIDQRYEPLKPWLPRSGSLGYLSDVRVDTGAPGADPTALGSRRFDEAQYALAPLLLRYQDPRAPLVIANLGDPARLPAILREAGLVVVAQPVPGVALLRRR